VLLRLNVATIFRENGKMKIKLPDGVELLSKEEAKHRVMADLDDIQELLVAIGRPLDAGTVAEAASLLRERDNGI
jgi:hypothetical protein